MAGTRRRLAALGAIVTLSWSAQASAQTILVGCTGTSDCAPAMVAIEQGVFEDLGLDVEMVLISINSNIPAALLSDSIQIGGPTTSTFLSATEGGLDLVAVAGSSFMSEASNAAVAAFNRADADLMTAQDFVGAKVGAPGLGAFLHVLFVEWLEQNGIDPAEVNFVETPFSNMQDVVRTGAVDSVLTGGPMIPRFEAAGIGSVGPRYVAELGGDAPVIFFAASHDWADANPEQVDLFRQGIARGIEIMDEDEDAFVAAVVNFTGEDEELVRTDPSADYNATITREDIGWWVDILSRQGILRGEIDLDRAVLD